MLSSQLGKSQPQFSCLNFSNVSQIPGPALLNSKGTHVMFLICLLEVLLAWLELWGKHPLLYGGERMGDSQLPDSPFSKKPSIFNLSKVVYPTHLP